MKKQVNEYVNVLSNCALFKGFSTKQIAEVLTLVKANVKHFLPDEVIITQGEKTHSFGIVLSGAFKAVRYSASGDVSIISTQAKAAVFGEMLATKSAVKSPVSVVASKESEILIIQYASLVSEKLLRSEFGFGIVENLTSIMSSQYFVLQKKIRYLSIHSLRDKILEYLLDLAKEQGGNYTINVPFNREEMSQYLGANRSALSRELSRMRDDGIIDYDKNTFRIIKKSAE